MNASGYEDVNDTERLRIDLAMCRVVSNRTKEEEASTQTVVSMAVAAELAFRWCREVGPMGTSRREIRRCSLNRTTRPGTMMTGA